jgi:HlyD family secretion protein
MSEWADSTDLADERMLPVQPPWFIEWGNTIILAMVLLLATAASFVRYPDIMRATVIVSAADRTAEVVAVSGGRVNILVREGDDVAAGAYLAVVDGPVRFDDVRRAKAAAEQAADVAAFVAPAVQAGSLGELEPPYARLLTAHTDWLKSADAAWQSRKLAELQAQITDQTEVQRTQEAQAKLLAGEVETYRADLQRLTNLHGQKLLSDTDLDAARARLSAAEQRLQTARGAAVSGRMRVGEAQQALADSTRQFQLDRTTSRLEFDESRRALLAAIATWEQRYVLVAPVAGRVTFHAAWNSGQIVKPGDPLFTIVPAEHSISARAFLPRAGAAKVRAGQHAIVKLDDYPFDEYGGLRAVIADVAPIARDDRYAVTLRFPEGFRTSFGKTLDTQAEMRGVAEITTEDRTLFGRLFDRMRAVAKSEG